MRCIAIKRIYTGIMALLNFLIVITVFDTNRGEICEGLCCGFWSLRNCHWWVCSCIISFQQLAHIRQITDNFDWNICRMTRDRICYLQAGCRSPSYFPFITGKKKQSKKFQSWQWMVKNISSKEIQILFTYCCILRRYIELQQEF